MENLLEDCMKIKIEEADLTVGTINFDLAVQVEDASPSWNTENNNTLNNHNITYEFIEEIGYECGECHKYFLKSEKLQLHVEQDHQDSKQNLIKKVTDEDKALDLPVVNQNLVKKELISCDRDKEMRQYEYEISIEKLNLKEKEYKNMKLIPGSDAQYKCNICNKILRSKSTYEHIKFVHGNLQFECDICGTRVKSKYTLLKHMRRVHKFSNFRNLKFFCVQCPKAFVTQKSLNLHMKTCRSDPVKCALCPKVFMKQELLNLHMKNCHSNPVECELCKSKLKSKAYLYSHMRRMHSANGRVFHCVQCSKDYKSAHSLRVHTNNAHKKYNCKVCGKNVGSKYYYDKHLAICETK